MYTVSYIYIFTGKVESTYAKFTKGRPIKSDVTLLELYLVHACSKKCIQRQLFLQGILTLDSKVQESLKDIVLKYPSNAAVVNAIFMPSQHDMAYYRGMVEAFDQACLQGRASVMYAGEHIDAAHAKTARGIVELGLTYQQSTAGAPTSGTKP